MPCILFRCTSRSPADTDDRSRKVNGTTHTFRRPSQAATPSHPQSQTQARDANSSVPSNNGDNVYLPPHLTSRSSYSSRPLPTGETRYNKDQLLSIYESMRASSTLDQNLDSLFVGPWSVNANGRLDGKEPGPEVCWNSKSDTGPFGLIELTEEEKQVCDIVFMTSFRLPLANRDSSFSRLLSTHLPSPSKPQLEKVEEWESLVARLLCPTTTILHPLRGQERDVANPVIRMSVVDRCHQQKTKPSSGETPTPQRHLLPC